jgi:Flp pilus assembly protein CpaB
LSAPKRRRPTWVVFGAVMVGIAMLLGVWVFSTSSQRISVMVAARNVAPGEVVEATDLRVVEMGRTGGLRAIQPEQQQLVVGQAARGPIPEGTVLNTGLFASRDRVVPAGQVVVGAALEPGAAPGTGLAAGDRVDVLAVVKAPSTATGGSPVATVVASGTVWSVQPVGQGAASSKLVVSVLVPAGSQEVVAQAAADGRLRLSLVGVSP